MFKIINTATEEILATGLPSTNLDNAIELAGGEFINSEDENVIINGKMYYYDDLELVFEKDYKYTVYAIVNKNGLVNEYILSETDDKAKAIETAKKHANYDKLEPHPEEHTVEIRYNENFENGTYEVLDF